MNIMRSNSRMALVLILLLMLLSPLILGCASSSVTVYQQAPAKPYPCDVLLVSEQELPNRPEIGRQKFDRLAVISVDEKPIQGGAYDRQGDSRALGKVEQQACKYGADLAIYRRLGLGHFTATLLRFTE